jgi:flavin prenyltransferase
MEHRILIGVTGASGAIYAERLIEILLPIVPRIYLVTTEAGEQVVQHELRPKAESFSLARAVKGELLPEEKNVIRLLKRDDFFAAVASGSSAPTSVVVLPCSMGTLARITHGISSNLLDRAADVVLKQKKQLIMVPRETPLNTIHLRNMLSLAEMGAQIIPPVPAFYQQPKSIADMVDFVVGKVLEALEIDHSLYKKWNSRML